MKPSPGTDMLGAVWYSSYRVHIWARHCAESVLLIVYVLTEDGVRRSFLIYRWRKQTSSNNTQCPEIMGSPRFPSLGSGKAGIWTRAVKIWASPFYYLFLGEPSITETKKGTEGSGYHWPSLFSPEPCVKSSWYWRFGKLAGKNLFMKGLERKTKQVGKQSPHGQSQLLTVPANIHLWLFSPTFYKSPGRYTLLFPLCRCEVS